MVDNLSVQREKLRLSIAGLESQRGVLGDAIVEPALAALKQQLAMLDEQTAAQTAPAEERRLVTILFMDMVGSTSMAEKMDPEEWRQVVTRLHNTLGEAINNHHGSIAQYLGDGLLAFFGSKQAGEHDPENAILAALEGLTVVANQQWSEKVQLRAGIHTGLVVVGELGDAIHKEFTASGDAMNLAARLQSAAPAGGILISHDTYRYVRGVFDLTPRPQLTVKGKSEPIQTYLVRRVKPRPFHSVARGVAGVETRTIGREQEMQALQAAYLRAYEGHGLVWSQLVSEPGMGKSRLLSDLSDWIDLREETVTLLRARAFSDEINQPFALVRRMWFNRFQIADDVPLEQAETKWVERFKELYRQENYEEAAHALGLLVGLPFMNSPHIKAMRNDPDQVKGRAFVVSRELMNTAIQHTPLVVLLEDLQWTDAASWEYFMEVFLGETSDGYANGIFLLGTSRPEWHPPRPLETLLTSSPADGNQAVKQWGIQIPLKPLSDLATKQLGRELFQRVADIPESLVDLLVVRSEGVPYYSEEIVNWLIDHSILDTSSDAWRFYPERLKEQPLPATLQHLLLTRLSSLSQVELAALQRGAIFGRHFWTGGVEALGISNGAEVLNHLQPRGFVEAQPESAFQGDAEWSFHHNLLQEVTYESVLKRERLSLHKMAAHWLEKQARQAERLDEFAGLLGEHCERAGELSTAVDWYLQAARRAFGQGAPRAAKGFYTRALGLLPPVDRERRWQALLGREEALGVLSEADPWLADTNALLELAHAFGDDNYLAEAYLRQAICFMRTREIPASSQASKDALAAARSCGNEAIEAKALALTGVVGMNRGEPMDVTNHIEEALQIARRLGDDNVLSFVLYRAAFCYNALGDVAKAHSLQSEQIKVDHRLGNRAGESIGMGNVGSRYIDLGLYKQARAQIEQTMLIDQAVGSRRSLAYNIMRLGRICLEIGDLRKAYQLLEQSLREVSPTQDARGKFFALVLLGRALLAMDDAAGAARRISEALDLAMSQGLTAEICLCKAGLAACAVMQGRLDEAQKYIGEVWDYLEENRFVDPAYNGFVFHICADTFDALGEMDMRQTAIERGHQALLKFADKINVPAWRQTFLENVPDNHAVMEMWEHSQH